MWDDNQLMNSYQKKYKSASSWLSSFPRISLRNETCLILLYKILLNFNCGWTISIFNGKVYSNLQIIERINKKIHTEKNSQPSTLYTNFNSVQQFIHLFPKKQNTSILGIVKSPEAWRTTTFRKTFHDLLINRFSYSYLKIGFISVHSSRKGFIDDDKALSMINWWIIN